MKRQYWPPSKQPVTNGSNLTTLQLPGFSVDDTRSCSSWLTLPVSAFRTWAIRPAAVRPMTKRRGNTQSSLANHNFHKAQVSAVCVLKAAQPAVGWSDCKLCAKKIRFPPSSSTLKCTYFLLNLNFWREVRPRSVADSTKSTGNSFIVLHTSSTTDYCKWLIWKQPASIF